MTASVLLSYLPFLLNLWLHRTLCIAIPKDVILNVFKYRYELWLSIPKNQSELLYIHKYNKNKNIKFISGHSLDISKTYWQSIPYTSTMLNNWFNYYFRKLHFLWDNCLNDRNDVTSFQTCITIIRHSIFRRPLGCCYKDYIFEMRLRVRILFILECFYTRVISNGNLGKRPWSSCNRKYKDYVYRKMLVQQYLK